VKYGCKYVRYKGCNHFGENGGVKASVEMRDSSEERTTVVVEKVGGSCKACGKGEERRERRREVVDKAKYWRGWE
jgi:hypothetical protein